MSKKEDWFLPRSGSIQQPKVAALRGAPWVPFVHASDTPKAFYNKRGWRHASLCAACCGLGQAPVCWQPSCSAANLLATVDDLWPAHPGLLNVTPAA